MENNNTKEITNYEIDKNILFIMFGVIVLSLTIFGYKAINHSPCDIVNFDTTANSYRVGEIIRFKDFSEDAQEYDWDFGDSTTHRNIVNPFHTYTKPGKYTITLTVNNKCEFSKELVIQKNKPTIDSTRIAKFKIPNTIKVGELLSAKDFTKNATSWEWRFGETSEVNSTYKDPTYSYKTAGLKTVTLIVNGDPRYSSQQQISVLPSITAAKITPRKTTRTPRQVAVNTINLPDAPRSTPPVNSAPPTIELPKTPSISRGAFAKKIIMVSEEKASANDFKKYLCNGNLQTNTSAKGKKTTFIEFCEKIKGKKIKIKSLELFKNKRTNCIEYISIDYSKGLF